MSFAVIRSVVLLFLNKRRYDESDVSISCRPHVDVHKGAGAGSCGHKLTGLIWTWGGGIKNLIFLWPSSINQSIWFNETKKRLKPARTKTKVINITKENYIRYELKLEKA